MLTVIPYNEPDLVTINRAHYIYTGNNNFIRLDDRLNMVWKIFGSTKGIQEGGITFIRMGKIEIDKRVEIEFPNGTRAYLLINSLRVNGLSKKIYYFK